MRHPRHGIDPAYLKPTRFIESDHPEVVAFSGRTAGEAADDVERAVRLFYAVRDGIRYDPYTADLDPETFRASTTLRRGASFCVPKAILLGAAARALGIPSRLRFADVRNHLATERLLTLMRTDVFLFHGYTEMFLEDRWVKATPTFDLALCLKFRVRPLDFDGRKDATLHPFDSRGQRHMEYLRDRGSFADMPLEELLRVYRRHYPHFFDDDGTFAPLWLDGADFESEASEENP